MAAGRNVWLLLIAVRLFWVVLPQFGYIHPDEFFQGPEIVAGDILEVEAHRSWEFNSSSPIRSIVFPYLVSGPPFYILKQLTEAGFNSQGLILNAISLLTLPRLMMVLIGFIVDSFIIRMSKMTLTDPWSNLMLYGSSYVVIIYMSRTFSNTVEVWLFTALLYFVMSDTGRMVQGDELSKKNTAPVEGDKAQEISAQSQSGGFYHASVISSIIVMGIFNRPTFLLFSIVPYAYWLISGYSAYSFDSVGNVIGKIFICVPGAAVTSAVFTLLDSAFFGSPDEIMECLQNFIAFVMKGGCCLNSWKRKIAELFSHLICTPWNFIKYNMDTEHLAEHGIHPRYTHVVLNTQVLFGFLSILFLYNMIRFATSGSLTVRKSSHNLLLYLCYLVPLVLLSLFPHQEPRFLLPLIVPLTLVCGGKVFGSGSYKLFKVIWVMFNILAAMLYGGVHQAGLIPCMSYLQQHFYSTRHDATPQHVIFYHTYMPPRSLLTLPRNRKQVGDLKSVQGKVFVHDLAGASEEELHAKILDIMGSMKAKCGEIYVVSPATLYFHCKKIQSGKYKYKLLERFSPHLSMEDPPDLERDVLCEAISDYDCRTECFKDVKQEWKKIKQAFSLNMYEIELKYV